MDKQPAVYILDSKRNGTLHTGVTSNAVKRVWENKNDMVEGLYVDVAGAPFDPGADEFAALCRSG